MFNDFLNTAQKFSERSEPYAMALIVRRENPTSGKPGDKAIIEKDGTIHGWIGGGCTKGIVLKEALAAIRDGKPRLVSINPSKQQEKKPGVMHYEMTCQGKGSVDVYVEPVLPKPHLVIYGKSHIAMALCKIGSSMGYRVTAIAEHADPEAFSDADLRTSTKELKADTIGDNAYIVVSTQGEGDEQSLIHALQSKAPYIAFVSSRMKANGVFNTLRSMGADMEDLKRIKSPAGLDINAKLPEEVAVSILAEIIHELRTRSQEQTKSHGAHTGHGSPEAPPTVPEGYYLNPVCNIPIEKATAKYVLDYKDEKVYFCCDMCKVQFEAEPQKFIV